MKSTSEIRRENLKGIVSENFGGKQIRLATALQTQPNLVSRWLNGVKSIGDSVARKIEAAAQKPVNWLDSEHVTHLERAAALTARSELGKIVAANLRAWMESSGKLSSQQKVANASGVSQATVNRLLHNESSITLDNLAAISAAVDRRPFELLLAPNDDGIIHYDIIAFAALTPDEKALIESLIEVIILRNRQTD